MPEILQLIIAGCSTMAAIFAAYATWQAPHSAAKIAEQMRKGSEESSERRRNKLHVFAKLMQERASLSSIEGVRALNLIDVIFHDSREVREAWAELFLTFDGIKAIPSHVQEERLRKLLLAMASDLNLGSELRSDDLGRVYYPNALAETEYVQQLERRAAKARLEGQNPSAN